MEGTHLFPPLHPVPSFGNWMPYSCDYGNAAASWKSMDSLYTMTAIHTGTHVQTTCTGAWSLITHFPPQKNSHDWVYNGRATEFGICVTFVTVIHPVQVFLPPWIVRLTHIAHTTIFGGRKREGERKGREETYHIIIMYIRSIPIEKYCRCSFLCNPYTFLIYLL